ncbi:uncharacterized protein LOC124143036 isoform X2 [Haliotis rufescens]|uniref:uncharacterized protein LOC124143036 isoform X2 n=1 Tax=Haliotis rufescens TaxID=6454 RepID=UPI00201EE171|nr:uncharacterized protein LOC124143036 isoform X2 [Haliotis rufescens]
MSNRPDTESSYYPVGNSRSVDVTLGCQVAKECDILLLGCGDIRNVLHTLHVLHQDGTTKSKGQIINFHLNDHETGILGRDLILLHLAQTIDPTNSKDLKFLWGVWYDVILTEAHLQRLKATIQELLTSTSGRHGVHFGNSRTEMYLKDALQLWLKFDASASLTIDKRKNFWNEWDTGSKEPNWLAGKLSVQCLHLDTIERLKDRYDGAKVTLSSLYLEILREWVESYQAALRHGCDIKIYLWHGEATAVCETDIPDLKFDFIDASNIADIVGLIPVLTCSREKAKTPDAVIRTEIFHWNKHDVAELLRECLNVSTLMYPTVLGLHLAEDLTLGHENLVAPGTFNGLGKLSLRWKTAEDIHNLTSLTVTTDDALAHALAQLKNPTPFRDKDKITYRATMCDSRVREKLIQRIQDSTKGQTNAASGASPRKTRTVVEYTDHYQVTITTDPECLKDGKFTMDYLRENPRVVVFQNIRNGHPSFKKILRLSCGISVNSSKFTLSIEKGTVDASIVKDVNTTLGERVLPWKQLDEDTVARLPDFVLSKSGKQTLDTYIAHMYITPPPQNREKAEPVQQLQYIIDYIMKNQPLPPGERQTILTIGAPDTSRPGKRFINILVLEGLKIHENIPTMFLKFSESLHESNSDWLEKDPSISQHLSQGYMLLLGILEANHHRMAQGADKKWMWRTFLRGRYPYMDPFLYRLEWFAQRQEGIASIDTLEGFEILALKDVFTKYAHSKVVEILQNFAQGDNSKSKGTGPNSSRETATTAPSCSTCGMTSPECKRCSRCLQVSYCSRECQQKAWPGHKNQCKSKKQQ